MAIKLRSPFVVTRKSLPPPPSVIKLTDGTLFSTYFPEIFGTYSGSYDTVTIKGQMGAYSKCAPVNSIVNKQADCIRNGKHIVEDAQGNEIIPRSKYLVNFLTKPNPIQTYRQFLSMAYAFMKIHGIAYALPVYGVSRTEPTSFYVVPNFMVTPVYSGKVLQQTTIDQIITEYRVSGISQPIKAEDMLVFMDSGVGNNTLLERWLTPQSRLVPIQDQVNSVIAATDAWLTLSKRKGIPFGIISSGTKDSTSTIPLTPEEKDEAHAELNTYGMSGDQKKIVITTAALNFQSISLPVKDLMILEGVESNSRHIANQFNYPFELLGYDSKASMSNGGEFTALEKRHYVNQIIPDAEQMVETINAWWGLTASTGLIKVTFDHLEIFSKSKKEVAEAVNLMARGLDIPFSKGVITKEEYRTQLAEVMNIDPININGNTYYSGNQSAAPDPNAAGQGAN